MDSINILVNTNLDSEGQIGCTHLIHQIITRSNPDYNIRVDIAVIANDRILCNKKLFGLNLNPTVNYENVVQLNGTSNKLTIVFHDKTNFFPKDYFPNYILSLAPGLDNIIRKSSCVNLNGLSHKVFLVNGINYMMYKIKLSNMFYIVRFRI